MDGYELCSNSTEYSANFSELLDNMISEMTTAMPSYNLSESFLRQIIPYFDAAAAMSENITGFTTNIKISRFASNTKRAMKIFSDTAAILQGEIPPRSDRVRDCRVYNKNADIIMNNLFYGMNAVTAKRVNCNFLSEIIAHHDGGIRLCENILKFDIASELRPFVCAAAAFLCENRSVAHSLSAKLSCGG